MFSYHCHCAAMVLFRFLRNILPFTLIQIESFHCDICGGGGGGDGVATCHSLFMIPPPYLELS
jgi:hypothetical protein